ncbi:MAG: HyaD/HybD family hydrogenase maturation endopeptidase [Bacillota bacterium]
MAVTGKENPRVLVLGVGNDLLTDEGIGVHVARRLANEPLPPDVTVYDGGVGGIDLLEVIQGCDRLIIVDAVNAQAEPGTVFRFRPDEVECILREHKTSLHQVDLFDTIKIARFLGSCPEIVVIGIQPKEIDWGLALTPELTVILPGILALVRDEIEVCRERSEASGY